MQVKWADPELQVKKKKAVDESNADNRMVSGGAPGEVAGLGLRSCVGLALRTAPPLEERGTPALDAMPAQRSFLPGRVPGLCRRPPDRPVPRTLQLFFAKVLRSATEEEVRTLFSGFGKVYDVNLFRAFQGAPTTKVSLPPQIPCFSARRVTRPGAPSSPGWMPSAGVASPLS